jgi:chemotaxis protein CheD
MDEADQLVGMADGKVGRGGGRLVAYGLGSCVGVALYDPLEKTGGLAHVMLPSSLSFPKSKERFKFADRAIEELLTEMARQGARKNRVTAKLVGGANMINVLAGQAVPIGLRNVMAARAKCLEAGLRVEAEDVGGTRGRTLFFSLADGRIQIRMLNQPEKWI